MYKFAVIISHVSGVTSIIGLICAFVYPPLALVLGGFSLFTSVMNVWFGDQNNFVTEIIAIGVGVVIGLLFEVDMVVAIAGAVCGLEAVIAIVGWIALIFMTSRYR